MSESGSGTPARGRVRRRATSEWLLLPVLALPLLVAGGALAFARTSHRAAIDGLRGEGAVAAARWLGADPARAAWVVARFDEALAGAASESAGWIPFRRGAVSGLVRRSGAAPGGTPWVLAADYPAGLRPDALANAAVRLSVESGTPIARSPGADEGTAALADFLAAPSPPSLRAAPLPAAFKLHLLRRSECGDAGDLATLAALRDVEDAIDAAGARLRPGSHVAGSTRLLVPPLGGPLLVLPAGEDVPSLGPSVVCEDPEGIARLAWTLTAASPDGDPVWRGRLEAPLAGEWTIVLDPGASWWNSGAAARWAVPLAAGSVVFLAIPIALFVGLQRRRRLDEARARFVNEIAHDLRTPVAALRLHADLLASGRVAEADRAKHAEILGREAARLTALLGNLLDLSRVEGGVRPFERERVHLGEVVRDAVREFGTLHPRRSADVRVECPEDLVVVADRTAVARSLANLLDNAGKFSPEGAAIRVRAEALGANGTLARGTSGGARVVVEDEGPGIDEDERSRVFLPYERGSAAARTAAPGTGLGLALVRELVEGMGGEVSLLDAPRGAAFEIRLPGGEDGRIRG